MLIPSINEVASPGPFVAATASTSFRDKPALEKARSNVGRSADK
jgi:hypothetical protein